MATQRKITFTDPEEKKRIKAAKERDRAQMAFSTILKTMGDISRDDVNNWAIEMWRKRLNIARIRGAIIKVKDFLILAESGDPFNVNKPSYRELAEWFVEQHNRFRPNALKVHVRGLHYDIVTVAETDQAVYLPNGKRYENTELRWHDLQRAGKYARYLKLIDPSRFDDRRSHKPIVHDFSQQSRSLSVYIGGVEYLNIHLEDLPTFPEFPDFPDFPNVPWYGFTMKSQQRYRLEVWIEKSTQEHIIQSVCNRHQITSVTATGEISITSMWDAIKRAEDCGPQTTTIILYISDFDPAGRSMPVAAARKLEFLRRLRHSDVSMRLYPIALTHEQCIEYQLPRTPLKETDARKKGFEYLYGSGATELDALESLHPGELEKILERAIRRFTDNTVKERTQREVSEVYRNLGILEEETLKVHDLDDLKENYKNVEESLADIVKHHQEYERIYAKIVEDYDFVVRAKFEDWHSQSFEPLKDRIHSAMEAMMSDLSEKMPNIENIKFPEAAEVPLRDDCLFDTTRDYVPQLEAYKTFAGKFEHLVEEEEEED